MPVYRLRLNQHVVRHYNEHESGQIHVEAPDADIARALALYADSEDGRLSEVDWDVDDTECFDSNNYDGIEINQVEESMPGTRAEIRMRDYPEFMEEHSQVDVSASYANTNV